MLWKWVLVNNFLVTQEHDELNALFNKWALGCWFQSCPCNPPRKLLYFQRSFSKELFTSGKKPAAIPLSFSSTIILTAFSTEEGIWIFKVRFLVQGAYLERMPIDPFITWSMLVNRKAQHAEESNYKQTLKAASVSSIKITFNAQSSLTLGGGANTAASIRLVALPRVCGRALPTRLKAEKWSTRTETELESTWHWSPRESRPWSATFFHSDGWPAEQRQQSQRYFTLNEYCICIITVSLLLFSLHTSVRSFKLPVLFSRLDINTANVFCFLI